MAKAKTVDDAAELIESAVESGSEKVRETMDKATKGFEKMTAMQKEAMEAFMASAEVTSKGAEKIQAELTAYMKSAAEGMTEASKAVFGAKTLKDAMEAQTSYMKTSLETYGAEMTKITEMMSDITRDAMAPFQGPAKSFMAMMQPSN
jgi:phasin family protein